MRAEREFALSSVGTHRAAPLGALGGAHDELAEATGASKVNAVFRDEREVERPLGVVLRALSGREIHSEAHCLVGGQVLACELSDIAPVGHGPDQRIELGVFAVRPLGRGRQSEAKGGNAELRRERVRGAGKVMTLVEDDEPEARPEALHVEVGRVVRRDGERPDVVIAATDDAHGNAERGAK